MVQRRKGKYRIQIWVIENGRRIKRSFTFSKKADADKKLAENRQTRELVRAGLELPADDILVFDYARTWMLKRSKSLPMSTTLMDGSRLKNYVLPYIGGLPMKMVTTAILRKLLDDSQERGSLSNSTRNRIRAVLHTMFRDAFMEEKIVANPMARIPLLEERPARPRALSVHEAEALIEVCYDLSPSTGFCAVLMIWQGLRVSNAVSVCYEDFDLERNELTISRLLEQATMKIRDGVKGNAGGLVLPLFPRAKEAFLTHMKLMRPKDMSQGCIVNIDGTQLDTYQARRAIKKASKRLGIYSTPHVLRATFASLGEEAGYSKEDIQRMLGHSSIQTTQRYTRRTAQPLFEKGQRLGFGSLGSAKLGDKMVTKDMEHPTKCDEKTTPKKALTTRKDR